MKIGASMEGLSSTLGRFAGDLRETGEMIAFKHSIFALPFAVISLLTAAAPSWPSLRLWLWIGVAMVSARTAAMAFNRLADHRVDAENPRTADRSLPAGRLSRRSAWVVTTLSAVLFVVAAAALNQLCLALAVPTLVILLGYSYAKRFTAASHFWLGIGLGIAPVGAWIAVTGRIDWPPVILAGAVCLWVAGFDIIYSLQDEDFDRNHRTPLVAGADRWTRRPHDGPGRARARVRRVSRVCRCGGWRPAPAGGGCDRWSSPRVATSADLGR